MVLGAVVFDEFELEVVPTTGAPTTKGAVVFATVELTWFEGIIVLVVFVTVELS